MKKSIILSLVCAAVLGGISVTSCDVLEKVPGSDVTEDTIFSTQRDFESFLFGTYTIGLHSYYAYWSQNGSRNPNPTMCITAGMTDEAEMPATWQACQNWNSAAIQKASIVSQEDRRWTLRYDALRRANIIIERVMDTDFCGDAQKRGYRGEALFIRALNHFEIFKRYGGMPIVDKRFGVADDWNVPRSSVEDYVNFMVSDCDAAAEDLRGITYAENQRGRITRAAALTLKAKILLFAASPLFNTGTPYLPTDHPELVCYTNFDRNRWKLAADAAQEALTECAAEGFHILNTGDPENDYRKVWEEYDNPEIILAEKFAGNLGNWTQPWVYILPNGLNMNGWSDSGVGITHNFVAKYEKMDGTPMQWNEPGVVGDDIMDKYAQLDPRFRQTAAYNGSLWNNSYPEMKLYKDAPGDSPNAGSNVTGVLMHKLIPRSLENQGSNYQKTPNGTLFRVAELYLNLAEALNEYGDSPSQDVYDAVNVVRARAGMPGLPAGLSKDQMRERIKNERAIELSFEDHRFWDIRRWMDAEQEGVMKGKFYKEVLIYKSGSFLNMKCDYTIELLEERSFNRNMYLHPIVESEVNKGYLTQNPGW